jgi:hypothetical protein
VRGAPRQHGKPRAELRYLRAVEAYLVGVDERVGPAEIRAPGAWLTPGFHDRYPTPLSRLDCTRHAPWPEAHIQALWQPISLKCKTKVVTDVTEASVQLVSVPLDWSDAESARAGHVNQALGQLGPPGSDGLPDGIYVSVGVVPPPLLIEGDPARSKLLEKYTTGGVKVNVVGQFHMSRAMLNDFIQMLQTTAINYDAAVKSVSPGLPDVEG